MLCCDDDDGPSSSGDRSEVGMVVDEVESMNEESGEGRSHSWEHVWIVA